MRLNSDISSTAADVEKWVRHLEPGTIFFLADINVKGTYEAIKRAVHTLLKEQMIQRIASGIYLLPKKSKLLGSLLPSIDDIVEAIARRDNLKIQPSGAVALNKLGLSTQIPLKHVYYTDGAARQIKVGRNTIVFKTKSPKRVSQQTQIGALLIAALEELGPDGLNDEIINKLFKATESIPPEEIAKDAKTAPLWMQGIFKQLIHQKT